MRSKDDANLGLALWDWLKKESVIRHGVHLLVFGLVVFFCVVAWMSWLEYTITPPVRVQEPAGMQQSRNASRVSSAHTRKSLEEYRQIISGDIFGISQKEKDNPEPKNPLQDIPISERGHDLKLLGTIVGLKDLGDRAIIKDKKHNTQKMYTEGDRIRNITVRDILRNNVIIRTPQGEKVLTMQPKELRPDKGGNSKKSAPNTESGQYDATRRISKSYVMESLQNVGQLMDQALIRRMVRGDKTVGFRVDNIQAGSFYEKIGLQNSDVITQVDGKDLKKPQQFMNFSQKLKNKDSVTLTVNRNGKKRSFKYNLQ